jgi:hypothetical protein
MVMPLDWGSGSLGWWGMRRGKVIAKDSPPRLSRPQLIFCTCLQLSMPSDPLM